MASENRQQGRITKIFIKKKHGFIENDIFFYFSDHPSPHNVKENELVEYELTRCKNGKDKAVKLKLIEDFMSGDSDNDNNEKLSCQDNDDDCSDNDNNEKLSCQDDDDNDDNNDNDDGSVNKNKKKQKCKYGNKCKYYIQGKCEFSHSDDDTEDMTNSFANFNITIICSYCDLCKCIVDISESSENHIKVYCDWCGVPVEWDSKNCPGKSSMKKKHQANFGKFVCNWCDHEFKSFDKSNPHCQCTTYYCKCEYKEMKKLHCCKSNQHRILLH